MSKDAQKNLDKVSKTDMIDPKEFEENCKGNEFPRKHNECDIPEDLTNRQDADEPFNGESDPDDVDESTCELTKDKTRAKRRKADARRKVRLFKKASEALRGARSRFKRDMENHAYGHTSSVGRAKKLCKMVDKLTNKRRN